MTGKLTIADFPLAETAPQRIRGARGKSLADLTGDGKTDLVVKTFLLTGNCNAGHRQLGPGGRRIVRGGGLNRHRADYRGDSDQRDNQFELGHDNSGTRRQGVQPMTE